MKILLLEDDLILNELISEYLQTIGYDVISVFDGYEAIEAIKDNKFELFLFDVSVPELNGFELLRYLNELDIKVATIFVTSRSSIEDVEEGFNLGCIDYIKKPFELKELELRIESIKKRFIKQQNNYFFNNEYSYNYYKKAIICNENEHTLTQKESDILEYLIKNRGRLVSLDELIANIWGFNELPTYATIRTYIKNLRKQLPKNAIKTVKAQGYLID